MRNQVLRWGLVLALCGGTGGALAAIRPAELPPPDFPSDQYIDSQGCVFMRDGHGWTPRLLRDGSPVCGYPPTLAGVGQPDIFRAPADPVAQAGQQMQEALISSLHPGELVTDPRPMPAPTQPAPPAPQTPSLQQAVRAAPAVQAAMARQLAPNTRLCALLGYDGDENSPLGADPTRGYCATGAASGALVADLRQRQGKPATQVAAVEAKPVAKPADAKPKPASAPDAKPTAKPTKPTKAAPKGDSPLMVPAGARYAQIGVFANETAAGIAVSALQGAGYPVARGRIKGSERVSVMAGPFADRAALIAAMDRLRKAGYRQVLPR